MYGEGCVGCGEGLVETCVWRGMVECEGVVWWEGELCRWVCGVYSVCVEGVGV